MNEGEYMTPIAKAIDCFSPLTADGAKALYNAGISAVGRYLGQGAKCLTSSEVTAIQGVGLSIISVYETNPTYPGYFTHAQGVSDAKTAVASAQALTQPSGTAIYFAVDYDCQDADMTAIRDYFDGVKSAIGPYKVGVYGGLRAVSNVAADFYWQTCAWSPSVSPRSAIYQSQCDTTLCGFQVDIDIIYKPCGWWPEQKTAKSLVLTSVTTYDVAIEGRIFKALAYDGDTYVIWAALDALGSQHDYKGNGLMTINGQDVQGVIFNGDTYLPWNKLAPGITAHHVQWAFTN